MRARRLAAGLAAAALAAIPAPALETDQFYAWTQPLADASDAINERANAEISEALRRLNERRSDCPCRVARNAIRRHLHYPFITQMEIWALNAPNVERYPRTFEEETTFRRTYLYKGRSPFDPVRWLPPSPTIEVAGIRMGTDKLGHFFSVGAWIEGPYQRALKKGASPDEAIEQAMTAGIWTEQTILGGQASGVVSLGDLEANYQGLLFFRAFCEGPDPALVRTASGWQLKRPVDIREFVSPEWDESWQPNIYRKSRWEKIKPSMERYCPLLADPRVQRQRAAYALRDRETPTEALIARLVAEGKLPDPQPFTINAVCGGVEATGLSAAKGAAAEVD